MKRLLFWMTICALLLSGCGNPAPEQDDATMHKPMEEDVLPFPGKVAQSFTFCSGVGAWSTELHLNRDGTFYGTYHDTNMGETGDGYPEGTVYVCGFEGAFQIMGQIDEYTYSLQLSELTMTKTPGTEEIIDDVRYVAAGPYGLEGGTEFLLYLPGTPCDRLTEEFLFWQVWMGDDGSESACLSSYAIRNVAMEHGFFAVG